MEGTDPLIGPSEHWWLRPSEGCLGFNFQSHWTPFLDHQVWTGVARLLLPLLILRFRMYVERRTLAEYRTRIGPSLLDDLEPRLSTVICSGFVDSRGCGAVEQAVWRSVTIPVRILLWRRVTD